MTTLNNLRRALAAAQELNETLETCATDNEPALSDLLDDSAKIMAWIAHILHRQEAAALAEARKLKDATSCKS